MEAREGRTGVPSILAILLAAATAVPLAAQETGNYVALNVSLPYSSTAFGAEGRWSFGDEAWSLWAFGSALTVGETSSGAWLGETLLTRSLGNSRIARHLFAGVGVRLSQPVGVPTEITVPAVFGLNVPLIRASGLDVNFVGHLGVARRQADGETVYARTNRLGLVLGSGPLRLSLSHDDAAGSNSPFNYGGAVRLSFGLRVR